MNSESHPGRQTLSGQKSIILVEDEPLVRNFFGLVLRRAGYHVFEADNADMAKAYASNGHHVDLLMTDYQMPGMNGVQLARWFRQKHPEIPVLVVTSLPDVATMDAMYHATFVCRAKPILAHELLGTVEEMFVTDAA